MGNSIIVYLLKIHIMAALKSLKKIGSIDSHLLINDYIIYNII